MVKEFSDRERKVGLAFLRALDVFTDGRSTIPTQYVRSFLLVALDEGKPVGEYAVKSGVSPSVMSRHLLDIGEFTRTRKPGLGLLYTKPNMNNLREHCVYLSDKGRALYLKLIRQLEH